MFGVLWKKFIMLRGLRADSTRRQRYKTRKGVLKEKHLLVGGSVIETHRAKLLLENQPALKVEMHGLCIVLYARYPNQTLISIGKLPSKEPTHARMFIQYHSHS